MNINFDVNKAIFMYEEIYPHKTAIQYENETITYRELAVRVRKLLWQLQEAGVKKGDIIAVGILNSIELIVAIYSILSIRAIVLPIDIMLPIDRIMRIFMDSHPKYILCKEESQKLIIELDLKGIYIDKRLENSNIEKLSYCIANNLEEDDAFCIYTSGTTGKPKGVLLNYKGIINHAIAKINLLGITQESKICLSFNAEFVAAIWQILAPLLCAATLVIYNRNLIKMPYHFFRQIEEDKITVVSITPHTLQGYLVYLKNKKKLLLLDLTHIILTGEKLNSSVVKNFYEQYSFISLINAYGQTECSDDSYHYIIPNTFSGENVPIGTPILNMKGFVLDENLDESNIGELYLGGVGVVKGYLHDEELTKKNFLKTSLFPTHLYKTGDWVKMDRGMLIYLGRIDNQVKIRGYRVELEEIENYINTYKGIEQCIVREIYINKTDKILEAMFVASEIIEINLLKKYLAAKLPEYMIPNKYTRVEKFAYVANGKIDKKKTFKESKNSVINGLSELQAKILRVITSFLSENISQDVSFDNDLSSIGIDSITYVKMVVALEEAFDFEFDNEKLFVSFFTTIRDIIDYIAESIKKV